MPAFRFVRRAKFGNFLKAAKTRNVITTKKSGIDNKFSCHASANLPWNSAIQAWVIPQKAHFKPVTLLRGQISELSVKIFETLASVNPWIQNPTAVRTRRSEEANRLCGNLFFGMDWGLAFTNQDTTMYSHTPGETCKIRQACIDSAAAPRDSEGLCTPCEASHIVQPLSLQDTWLFSSI